MNLFSQTAKRRCYRPNQCLRRFKDFPRGFRRTFQLPNFQRKTIRPATVALGSETTWSDPRVFGRGLRYKMLVQCVGFAWENNMFQKKTCRNVGVLNVFCWVHRYIVSTSINLSSNVRWWFQIFLEFSPLKKGRFPI